MTVAPYTAQVDTTSAIARARVDRSLRSYFASLKPEEQEENVLDFAREIALFESPIGSLIRDLAETSTEFQTAIDNFLDACPTSKKAAAAVRAAWRKANLSPPVTDDLHDDPWDGRGFERFREELKSIQLILRLFFDTMTDFNPPDVLTEDDVDDVDDPE